MAHHSSARQNLPKGSFRSKAATKSRKTKKMVIEVETFLKKRFLWSMEHAGHRGVIVDTPYRFSQKVRYRQHSQLGKVIVLFHRNGVRNNHLLEQTAGQPLNCRWTVKENRFINKIFSDSQRCQWSRKNFLRQV